MGFLKDLRKLRKQSKELAEQSGVDTSMRGLLRQAPGMMQQATEALSQVQQGREDSESLRQSGIRATATIVAARDTGMTLGGAALGAAALENPVVDLDLEVTLPGGDPYPATIRQIVPRLAIGRLVPGTEVPALVDRHDRHKLLVDWDAPA